MLSHGILEIVFPDHPAIWAHFSRTNITLAHVGPLRTLAMHILVDIRELEHIFKWITHAHAHHGPKKWITPEASESPHHLMHLPKRVMTVQSLNLSGLTVSPPTHFLL